MGADLSSGSNNGPISAINVTPFVDVVLVLLVIFMVTAPAIMKDVLGVKLPKSASSSKAPASSLGVAVTRQGQFMLDGKTTTLERLSQAVAAAVQANPKVQAIISADQEARHGDVVKAIDTIKSAGLERFALQIQKSTP